MRTIEKQVWWHFYKLRVGYCGLLLAALLIGSSQGDSSWAEEQRPILEVLAEAEVEGEEILLADISSMRGGALSLNDLLRVQQIQLGDSPQPDDVKIITGESLVSKLQEAGFSDQTLGYSVPRAIRVRRSAEPVKKETLFTFFQDEFSRRLGEVQIREVHVQGKLLMPGKGGALELVKITSQSAGKVNTEVRTTQGEREFSKASVVVHFNLWKEVPVANRVLDKGAVIEEQDLVYERREVSGMVDEIILENGDLVGRRVKNKVAVGSIVRKQQVEVPPVISRGKLVTMRYTNGMLVATASGEALADGLVGEVISLRNPSSKKMVKGIIEGPNSVRVTE